MKFKVSRPRESYVMLSTLFFTEQFDRNLDLDGVAPSFQRKLLEVLNNALECMTDPFHPAGICLFLLFTLSIMSAILGRKTRKLNDLLAIYLSVAWVVELFTMNALLLSPLKSPTLLLIELVLFMPVIVTAFAWWYWRLNVNGNHFTKGAPIGFTHTKPTAIDYFSLSLGIFFKNNVTSHTFRTKTARITSLINSMVALNILGLTLTRAVSVAIH